MLVRRLTLLFIAVAILFVVSLVGFQGGTSSITGNKYRKLRHIDKNHTKVVFEGGNQRTLFSSIVDRDQGYGTTANTNQVLILSSILDQAPYGGQRQFKDFMATLESLYSGLSYEVSLGFLVRSQEEFNSIEDYFSHEVVSEKSGRIGRITLLIVPMLEVAVPDGKDRHADGIQRERRRSIARARNFLLFNSLQDETYTLFVDSDIEEFKNSEELLKHFITSDLDIVVPRIVKGLDRDYDKNSWRGKRTKPSDAQLEVLDKGEWGLWDYVPRDVTGEMYHFEKYVKDKAFYNKHRLDLNYTVELDSVGGAVLFAKSIIYKQGIIFPTNYVIGTTWERQEGYDGIETEGLCYLAKSLGYKCWGMPNLVALHGDR